MNYIISIPDWNRVKIGYWTSDLPSLRSRYVTPYGNDYELFTVECAFPPLLERYFKRAFSQYRICNELYRADHVDEYKQFMTDHRMLSEVELYSIMGIVPRDSPQPKRICMLPLLKSPIPYDDQAPVDEEEYARIIQIPSRSVGVGSLDVQAWWNYVMCTQILQVPIARLDQALYDGFIGPYVSPTEVCNRMGAGLRIDAFLQVMKGEPAVQHSCDISAFTKRSQRHQVLIDEVRRLFEYLMQGIDYKDELCKGGCITIPRQEFTARVDAYLETRTEADVQLIQEIIVAREKLSKQYIQYDAGSRRYFVHELCTATCGVTVLTCQKTHNTKRKTYGDLKIRSEAIAQQIVDLSRYGSRLVKSESLSQLTPS